MTMSFENFCKVIQVDLAKRPDAIAHAARAYATWLDDPSHRHMLDALDKKRQRGERWAGGDK